MFDSPTIDEAAESPLDLTPGFTAWRAEVIALLKPILKSSVMHNGPSLYGSEENDGYSIDGAFDAWEAGTSPRDYAMAVYDNVHEICINKMQLLGEVAKTLGIILSGEATGGDA